MQLSKIRDTASKFAAAISRFLDVDVMIIDSSFVRIANTFRYVDDPPPVRPNTITGRVLTTGKVIVVSDKQSYEGCNGCTDKENCCISQIISVPIFYESEVVGAIDLLVPFGKHSTVFDSLEISIDFLERMADLLSSKLRNLDDYDKLSVIKKEREILLDFIEDALVYTNETGEVIHWNNQFGKLFRMTNGSEGKRIEEILDHPLVHTALANQRPFFNQEFNFTDRNVSFSGFLSYRIIQKNGVKYGMMFLLKSIDKAYGVLNDISGNRTPCGFDSFRTGEPSVAALLGQAKKLAVTDEPVLLAGPPGSGKSMLARAIHEYSDHAARPFVVVNCAGFSPEYLEDEIFGGGERSEAELAPGSKLRLAQDGTIYFSHIEGLPLYLQKRLTAIIKARNLSGKGAVVARMVFSSCADLAGLSRSGRFDEELAVRISLNTLSLPALDERIADLRLFCALFLDKYNRIYGRHCGFDDAALGFLQSRSWPGNVRQLERAIEQIVCTAPSDAVGAAWLADVTRTSAGDAESAEGTRSAVQSLEEMEEKLIRKALLVYPNKDDVAQVLKIGRATLYRKLKQYGISH